MTTAIAHAAIPLLLLALTVAVFAWKVRPHVDPTYLRAPCDDCGEDVWLEPVDDIALWERELST